MNLIPVNLIKERDFKQSNRDAIDVFKGAILKTRDQRLRSTGDGPLILYMPAGSFRKIPGGRRTVMISYAKTDTGLVRRSNQDFLFAADQPVGPLPNLFIVADGMGGHKAGDFASRYVVEHMKEYIENLIW